jgi:hypothetical protein
MKIVIQCSATKQDLAGTFIISGRRVKFIAHPELHPPGETDIFSRPDDAIPSSSTTWRQHLVTYNSSGANPDHLLQAGSLYSPPAYVALLRSVGTENFYILSAGWGLVRSDFLLPDYDITFSSQGEAWKRRTKRDAFRDFAHLTQGAILGNETVYFFGGKEYLQLYYKLTKTLSPGKSFTSHPSILLELMAMSTSNTAVPAQIGTIAVFLTSWATKLRSDADAA